MVNLDHFLTAAAPWYPIGSGRRVRNRRRCTSVHPISLLSLPNDCKIRSETIWRARGVLLTKSGEHDSKRIPVKVHPRAIAALGAELVTDDIVAVIELVKNSYDAMATKVTVRFSQDASGRFIEVVDDGSGMSREVIEEVWAVVATPFREDHMWSTSGSRRRRASGAKGIGRLAAARLGNVLEMTTQTKEDGCWLVSADWGAIGLAESLQDCLITLNNCETELDTETGTRVRIRELASTWTAVELEDLRENLSRLISPFETPDDFSLFLDAGDGEAPMLVEPPKFMSHPKYRLQGSFDSSGSMRAQYTYESPDGQARSESRNWTWNQVVEMSQAGEWSSGISGEPKCGPFTFEMRVWDIGAQDTADISDRWGIEKNQIRKAIRAHKGLSVYRDGILVIPKSEHARDWLGLDLRRVSKTGVRLSTSQIVGNIQIAAERNPRLIDTSDRERLVNTLELAHFRAMLFAAVGALESERVIDRRTAPLSAEPTLNFFRAISAEALLRDIGERVEDGSASEETLELVADFSASLEKTREELERRFVYYSRLATIGTIAQMLIHEIRNRTSVLRKFVNQAEAYLADAPKTVLDLHGASDRAVTSLDSLANTFAPLANRRFKRGVRTSNLREQVEVCLALFEQEKQRLGLAVENLVDPDARVAVDPGELDAVLVNLISNAVFWLDGVPRDSRRLKISSTQSSVSDRIVVTISDSGPGVRADIIESVMEPGFTLKPDGIGMGLTVAAEVVSEHGGKLGIASPGEFSGATLQFDVPSGKES